jgi:glycine betaine/proline transport system substrate-binding protein
MNTSYRRTIALVGMLLLSGALLFAEGQGEAGGSGSRESGAGMESSEEGGSGGMSPEAVTVRFAEVGWTDIETTTAATRLVLEAMGYETTSNTMSVPVAYEGLANGDLDIFLGNWMPSMASIANEYFDRGTVEQVAVNLEGAKYTLAVPTYLAEQGLTSFSDIQDFGEELNYQIHGIEAGNDGNQLIWSMIEEDAFGLGEFEVVASSEAGMLAEVRARARQEQPIVFLGWAPHPMNTYIDMTYLSGGDDYFGPDYGAATVYTNARDGFLEEYPNLERFFNNLEFTLPMENEIMTAIDNGEDAREAAHAWLRENPSMLDGWLQGVLTVDGEPAAAVVKERLGA